MVRVPLPSELPTPAWRVADARTLGVRPGRLRGTDLATPFHGVRAHVDGVGPVAAYSPRLRPGDRFSHSSAAQQLGAPLPGFAAAQLHVTAGPGLVAPRARGVHGHADDGRGSIEVGGVPVSTPEECFLELAGILSLADLVAVGDFLVLEPRFSEPGRPFSTIAQLIAAAAEPGRRFARRARVAAAAVRTGVESPQETRQRLLLVDAGLPEPICGFELRDARGALIGYFDQAWPQYRTLGEYDGDWHRTSPQQYEKDQWRVEAATAAGWRTVKVRQWGLREGRPDTVDRFVRALRAGGWRG
jgi:hypothetical protein